jgi:hypothetical protein
MLDESSLLCQSIGDKEKSFKTLTTFKKSLAYFAIALVTKKNVSKQ